MSKQSKTIRAVGVLILLGSIIGSIVILSQRQAIQNELAKVEVAKLGEYSDKILEGSIGKRLHCAKYFSTIVKSDELIEKWGKILEQTQKEYDQTLANLNEKKNKLTELKKIKQKEQSEKDQIENLEVEIIQLEFDLSIDETPKKLPNRTHVILLWHEQGFFEAEANEMKLRLMDSSIYTEVYEHVIPEEPDAIFIGGLVPARDAQAVLRNIPFQVKYIFPIEYPLIQGGDPAGYIIGVGYNSDFNIENRVKETTPIEVTEEDLKLLKAPNISNIEFQNRLRKILGS